MQTPPTPRTQGELKTFHIRIDGGNAEQCSGEADLPYPGEGTGVDCAWDHPFRALPPGETARIQGGDTLIIHAGSYPMGLNAVMGLDPETCNPDYPWDCVLPPIPSGLDAEHPTRILGAGWDQGCSSPPELWGKERAVHVLDLSGSQFVTLACLDISDHAACAEDHPLETYRCETHQPPFGDWAVTGLYAQDASQITLQDITIHGLGVHGILAGRISDWQVERTKLQGNGWVGWDGDIEGEDSNSGLLHFSEWVVEWNGCVENYPAEEMLACWAQPAGGYGDGVGTGETGGTWLIEDSRFRYNTSDGLDLLYGNEDIQVEIYQSWFEGNAGNQLKTNGPLVLENSVLIGNCAFFEGQPFTAAGNYDKDGKPESAVDSCRATGVTLSVVLRDDQRAELRNNTITGEGDCLVVPECTPDSRCLTPGVVWMRNNLFQGWPDFTQPGEPTCLFYQETFLVDPFDADYSAVSGVKNDACLGAHDICLADLGLANSNVDNFDPHLAENSPLIDAGLLDTCTSRDYWGTIRPQGQGCDIGAHEWVD